MDAQTKRLIVNADDFGYCSKRNAGIAKAFNDGVVSSVSLLVNAACSAEAVHLSHDYAIPMGLHLNLTEGSPIAQGHKTLTASDGFMRGKMGFRESLKLGEIDTNEIKTEIKAQLSWFQDNVGHLPTHVDGHQHAHVIPQIADILSQLMKEANITKTRNPSEFLEKCSWIEPSRKQFHLSVIQDAQESYDIFERAGISFPAHFVGMSTMGKDMNIQRIQNALLTVQCSPGLENVYEFMVHPGYKSQQGVGGCGEGPDKFALSLEREHELELLCSEQLKTFLNKEGFKLSSFKDI